MSGSFRKHTSQGMLTFKTTVGVHHIILVCHHSYIHVVNKCHLQHTIYAIEIISFDCMNSVMKNV